MVVANWPIRARDLLLLCYSTCSPSATDVCRETPNTNVKLVSCCWSHYCNGASGPVVNGILLTATVTASFMYLFGYSLGFIALSSAEAPAGYLHQNINNRKNWKRARDDGKRETAASLLSSPFPSCPARSLFLSPQPPHNTKASPQHKEASAEERGYIG